MSVRKRIWTTRKGDTKEAWIVDYTDQNGKRHLKTFDKKKQADAFATTAKVQIRHGIHTADSESVTVALAGRLWLAAAEKSELERTTVDQYRQHLDLHIAPYLGRVKLSQLTAPMVREFEDKLSHGIPAPGSEDNAPRSLAMVRKIRGSLGSILADAQERGLVARNVVRELRSNRRQGKERRAERRQKGKLKVGVDIPSPDEIKRILNAASGQLRPLLMTAIFTGLRASELLVCVGTTSISGAGSCMSGSARTAMASSASRNPNLRSERSRSARSCVRLLGNGSSPARRVRPGWYSPMVSVASKAMPTSLTGC